MTDAFASHLDAQRASLGPRGDELSHGSASTAPNSVSLVQLLGLLLRYRVSIFLLVIGMMALAVGVGLLSARTYTSTASFMPQSNRPSGSNLAGLAAQFGVAVPSGDGAQSPAFYADLVRSRQILNTVAEARYTRSLSEQDTISLSRLLKVKGADAEIRRAETVRRLKELIAANAITKTGVVTLSVRTTSPTVSQQVATRLIEEINRFNLQTRQSQAAAERQFTERRLREVRDSLRAAENALQAFLQSNRVVSSSSQLQFVEDRLRRDVTQRQEVYNTLAQAYEQAKIEEVRDTPVITVIEHPNLPVRPDSRGLVSRGLLAGLVGAMLGILLALLRAASTSDAIRDNAAFAELRRLINETRSDLRHPLRAVRRSFSR